MDIVRLLAMQIVAQVHQGKGTDAADLIEVAEEMLHWFGLDEPIADENDEMIVEFDFDPGPYGGKEH